MSDTSDTWIEVTRTDRIPEGDVVAVTVAGRELALYEAEGQFFATDNLCTHGHARMSDGFLEGCEIECPLHQGRFDIRTGLALCAPLTENLRTYPIQIQDGRVLVRLDDGAAAPAS